MSTVGIIVNPHAGKDIRRLVALASPTSDAAKIDIVRRVIVGAAEAGADRILLGQDARGLAARAAHRLDAPLEFVEGPRTGSALDTIAAATTMWKSDVGAVVALGGDGTCRDVATGWPDVPLVAVSTGTNNVYPVFVDGTTAGTAAALVASGAIPLGDVATPSKRVTVHVDDPRAAPVGDEIALVEAALITTPFVGARAVTDPRTIRWVVAAVADPAATGLAGLAGRIHPVGADDAGGVLIHLGGGGRRVRVPLAPGVFETVEVSAVEPLGSSATVDLPGGGVLAYDGERTSPVSAQATVTVSIERSGPRRIDVDRTLARAAEQHRFDLTADHGTDLRGDDDAN